LKLFQNGGWESKEIGGGGEFKYNILIIVRTFVNATMYPHPAQQFKKEENEVFFFSLAYEGLELVSI
jgi:hypothetical protein